MLMLKVLAIVVGIVAIASRLAGVMFPGFFRKLMKLLLEEKGVLLYMLVLGAVLGAFFIWGFRMAYDAREAGWQGYVLLVFGCIVVLLSLLSLAAPGVLTGFLTRLSDLSSTAMRLICLAGVVVGVLILLLGVSM